MAIQIILNDPKHVYHPGQTVFGVVRVEPETQLHIKSVNAGFEGCSRSHAYSWEYHRRYAEKIHFNGEVDLYKRSTQLIQGPFTINKPQQWNFTFQIPNTCMEAKYSRGATFAPPAKEKAFFNQDRTQQLPPSFASSQSTGGAGATASSITFYLKAWIGTEKTNWDINTRKELKIMPFREESMRNPILKRSAYKRRVTISSFHLDPESSDKKLSMKQRLQSTLQPSTIPSLTFALVVEVPNIITIRQPLPIIIRAISADETSQRVALPPVKLLGLRLLLVRTVKQITAMPLSVQSSQVQSRGAVSWNERISLGAWNPKSVYLNEGIKVEDLRDRTNTHWERVVPDFKTFNISLTHDLLFECTVEVGGKSEQLPIPTGAITVLSPYFGPQPPTSPLSTTAESASEQLPPYSA